ncbi:hypothetical protein SAMN00768000_2923 [Sulfobacillus thermosulfidooxidans DSM 9293]|uniref:Uncharacterized protein n=2 Tax=Sulfobacillus thermosulfidooxidans TaxID=28034 RepID=A0A1W1WLN0_SULTA|nr:hypothetical protein [Sulfobacillus thermosulfidooxidans]PSR27689.1 MAG: hypothetical protein C7B47_07575 [Sulfobacillus thermosulfidooxidans]SMC06633.1 hypothetical protein SAMN00768000_2923 [Sulfobacillus thermosulfidooxidans DSM 9293]
MKIVRLGYWSAFTLGLLTGLSLMQGVTAQERMQTASALEKWHMEANYWKKEANQLKNELGTINRKSETQLYIQDIAVNILKSPVPKDDVIEAMAPYTQALLGLSLQYLKLPVIYHLFNNRIIVIGTRLYQIRVHALLLGPHTELIISVSPDPSAQSL